MLFFLVPLSSDLPAVVLETVGDVVPTPKANKQRLPRQLAVMDDDKVPQATTAITPPTIITVDDNVEDVTSSLNELSIGMYVCCVHIVCVFVCLCVV